MFNMDQIDQRLIALLRHNARESVATFGRAAAVSRGTVTNRLRRLEDEGVIVGYTLRLKPEAETADCRHEHCHRRQ
jgi:DNA-binding Lrp family transcriptional regulator